MYFFEIAIDDTGKLLRKEESDGNPTKIRETGVKFVRGGKERKALGRKKAWREIDVTTSVIAWPRLEPRRMDSFPLFPIHGEQHRSGGGLSRPFLLGDTPSNSKIHEENPMDSSYACAWTHARVLHVIPPILYNLPGM